MRRLSLWLLSTVAALVLLFSYRTSAGPTTGVADTVAVAPTSGAGVYTGDTVQTQEGDVQVAITVADGKITAVTVPIYPSGSQRHDEISGRALPVLVRETLDAQGAEIDAVSGATYTSEGFMRSLQSALDDAQLS